MRVTAVLSLVLFACLSLPTQAEVAYVSQDDHLARLDLTTGVTEPIAPLSPTVDALAFDADGTLFGVNLALDLLVTIDIQDASVTQVGPLGLPDLPIAHFGDLAFDGEVLYLFYGHTEFIGTPPAIGPYGVFEIDPTTGAATDTGFTTGVTNGLGVTAIDGALYIDQLSGGLSLFEPGSASIPLGTGLLPCTAPWALAADGRGSIWALRYDHCLVVPPSPRWRLDRLDPATGAVLSSMAMSPDTTLPSAIAIAPRGALAIPTLGEVGLVAMVFAMMLVAGATLRRRIV